MNAGNTLFIWFSSNARKLDDVLVRLKKGGLPSSQQPSKIVQSFKYHYYLCVVVHKYVYRNVHFTITAPIKYLICHLYAETSAKL
jgi:hypothetical protein